MESITKDAVLEWLKALGQQYSEKSAYLTELDAAIGDADHGTNMQRGFDAVLADLNNLQEKSVGAILKDAAMILIRTVGGSSGPLYGTLFLRMGHAVDDAETITPAVLVEMFDAGLKGVIERGKADVNDKTMVDALNPAVEAMRAALNEGKSLPEVLAAGVSAAEKGMTDTIPMEAHKGRASYLGERSVGHQDPGATSTYYLLKTAQDVWGN